MKKTAKQFTVRLLVLAMLVAFLPQAVIAANTEGTADLTITTLENLEDFLYKENEFNENTGVEKDAAAVVPDALPNLTPDESDTSKTTYLISSKDDMETLAEYINGGNSGENLTFKMTSNINLEGDKWDQWMPIGISDSQFCGTFDGAGYEISGLYIDNEDLYQGLFGDIGAGGIVQDLGVSGTITGSGFVGGITARLDDGGMIRNCHNAAEISCGFSGLAGGIVGHAGKATIEKCYNIGTVGGDFAFWIGGIVGMSESTVRNCYNTGTVFGSEWIGGIIGSNTATVENCYSIGTITGEFKAGGVTGSNSGSVENCFYLSGSADTSADGKALTEAQFAQRDTFTGWDFTDTWTMSSMLARPVLQNNTAGGAGTEKDPYIIPDLETLEQFRDAVNNGNTYEGKYVKLTADIDLNPGFTFDETGYSGGEGVPKQWTPIGLDTGKFSGVFDGGDHIIKGLYINETAGNGVGLFGWVDGGEIRNLTLENGLVNSKVSYTGGIVGSTDGIVKDCVNSVHIITESGNLHIGGIAGHCGSNSTLSGCRNTGSVSGGGYISGIVGSGEGKVENCSNTGNIAGGDINTGVAGIAGWARGMDIIDCYNTGNITSNNKNSYAGGIAGYCPGSVNILNCSSTGKVECLGIIVGGIAGYIPGGTVSACYNTGSVKGSSIVGGVVGYMTGGMVQNCYSTGAATGTVTGTPGADSITGGVIGFALKGTVENCYNNER